MNDWIKIYETNLLWQAELIKAVLEEHDVPAVVLSNKDSAYQFGLIQVLVQLHNKQTAEAILLSVAGQI
ncbi:MAG: putative signal transducing protein [Bacteroidia bacterium]